MFDEPDPWWWAWKRLPRIERGRDLPVVTSSISPIIVETDDDGHVTLRHRRTGEERTLPDHATYAEIAVAVRAWEAEG